MALSQADLEEIWSGRYIENNIPEMLSLVRYVEQVSPLNTILEIGVCWGGTLRLWEKMLNPDDLLIGVDVNPEVEKRITGELSRLNAVGS